MLAMLATAERGERSRAWLQRTLWGSRGVKHAQNSLRRELANLRRELNRHGAELIKSDQHTIRLDLDFADIDVRGPLPAGGSAEFLEGIDLPEPEFRAWLERTHASLASGGLHLNPPGESPGSPARGNPDRPLALALAVMPIELRGHDPDGRLAALRSKAAHLLIRFVRARKWLPILAAPEYPDGWAHSAEAGSGAIPGDARYILTGQLHADGPAARLILNLHGRERQQLLWTDTLHIADGLGGPALTEGIGRRCNALTVELFNVEYRRICSLPPAALGPAELHHSVRHLLGQLSLENFGLARAQLDRAAALGAQGSEQTILDAFLKVLSVIGSAPCDPHDLRCWASAAINADSTDWRGTLLAAIVDTWLLNPAAAIAHAKASDELCPWNPVVLGQLGMAYNYNGQPELALVELEKCRSLTLLERRPYLSLCHLAMAHLMLHQFEEAVGFCDQASACIPELGFAYLLKIDALVRQGRKDEAGRVFADSVRGKKDDLIAIVRMQRLVPPSLLPRLEDSFERATAAASSLA